MKHSLSPLAATLCIAIALTSCKKDVKPQQDEVPASVIAQVKALGFSTQGIQKSPDGYIVEGDINLTQSDLSQQSNSPELVIAQEEHYRTNNLVRTSTYPTIKVALNNSSSQHQAA